MTAPAAGLLFLSWLRSGMLASLDATAKTAGSLDVLPAANARSSIAVDATGASGNFTAVLHGPGEVQGIDPAQVVRREPPDGAVNVEVSFVPLVEFDRPDLPWLASPATPHPGTPTGADPRNGLLPWLCLVVVEHAAATVDASATPLPRLTVPVALLPDPAQAWLWAHAQLLVTGTETIQSVLDNAPDRTLSRLIAPRRLQPNTRYLAAVVPLFESGRQAGLGNQAASGSQPAALTYAWTPVPATSTTRIELPAYLHWTFSTGAGGDFRSLAALLHPVTTGQAGVRPLDIGHAGSGLPQPGPSDPAWTIPFEGPITGTAVVPGAWPSSTVKATYQAALADRVAAKPGELTPPQYGAGTPLDSTALANAPAWLRQLNLDPRYRAMAALGTAVVQHNSEALVASAWQQAGELRRVNDLLRRAQLAREISSTLYYRRVGAPGSSVLPDDRLLQVTTPVHDQVISGPTSLAAGIVPQTVSELLAVNPPAAATTSVAFRRLARPTGPVARRALNTVTSVPAPAPVPAPVSALGATTLKPVPPVTPVSGATSFEQLSASAVKWMSVTPQLVSTKIYPWESAVSSLAAALQAEPAPSEPAPQSERLTPRAEQLTPIQGELIPETERLAPADPDQLAAAAEELAAERRAALAEVQQQSVVVIPPPPVRLSSPYGYGTDLVVNDKQGIGLNFDALPSQGWTTNPLPQSWFARYAWSWKYTDLYDVCGVARLEVWNDTSSFLGTKSLGAFHWQPGFLNSLGTELFPVLLPFDLGPNVPWSAVVVTDVAGTGTPAVVLIWNTGSGASASNKPPNMFYYSVGFGLTNTSLPTQWTSARQLNLGMSWPLSATGAGGLIYLQDLYGNFTVVTLNAAGGVAGQHAAGPAWRASLPGGYRNGAIVAADFGGSFGADLVHVLATDSGAAMRVVYDVGEDASWGAISEITPLPIDITPGRVTASLGVTSAASNVNRARATDAFRKAAAATQDRQVKVSMLTTQPLTSTTPVSQLAADLRSQLNPAESIDQATTDRLSIDIAVSGGTDPLQPLVATPVYRVPTYDLLREQFGQLVFPGAVLPDNSATALVSNASAIEAFLVGMNAELSRELLWRQYPTQHGSTFFRRFWDRRTADGAPVNEIGPIERWPATSPLGSHGDSATSGLLLVVRGELLRRMPSTIVYAAPALSGAQPRQPDLTQRVDPLFVGHLDADTVMFSFPITPADAVGNNDNALGWFFVFAEHPTAIRFGLNEATPTAPAKPATWRALDWNQALGAGTAAYLDAGAAAPLAGTVLPDEAGGSQHRWGFSSAHMAHILLRPPTEVALHASTLVQLA